MKTRHIIIVLISCAIILSVVFFVFQFHDNAFSDNISDWGSFGDYVGGIILSLISIFLLYKTYKEQQYTNVITRFESRFWNLKCRIKLTNEELALVDSVAQKIIDHFPRDDHKRKLTNKEFVALLGYYWDLHIRDKDVFCSQYFAKLQNLIFIVTNSSMVKKQDKECSLSALFTDMTDNEIFCLLSYLAFYSYQKCDYSLFSYDAIFDLLIRCNNLCKHVCKINSDKITYVRRYIYDDYGYNDHQWKEESYTQTLNRVIYNKSI